MPIGARGPQGLTLRRKSPLPVWVQIGWRVALVLGLLVFAIAVHWFERDGLHDNLDGHVSFLDVIYFTMISITTTGYGDVVPVADNTRMFDALVVTPIRVFFVLIFIGTFGAACGGTSLEVAIDGLKSIPVAFTVSAENPTELITRIVGYAEQARRDGLLGLESQLGNEPNEILRAGLTMLVDGVDHHEATKVMRSMAVARS